jgi:hypothetical protein
MINKKYCIITPSIHGIGGAQFYTLRRVRHLQRKNCIVYIITGSSSSLALNDKFEGIEILTVPEVVFIPCMFPKNQAIKANNQISNFLRNKEIQVIESNSLSASIYAEVVSNEIKCKHVIYLLNEDKVKYKYGVGYSGFFDFKLKRGELFGVSSISLDIIFSKKINASLNKYINIPYDTDELINEKISLIDKYIPSKDIDYKILTITRLDKTYVKNLIHDLIKVSKVYNEKTFYLLIVGDSDDKKILKELKNIAVNSKNLKIVFSGYIYPMSSYIFKRFDLFIGMGTASISSISQGCATAIIDPRNNKSPGFLGVNTNNFAYPEIEIDNITIEKLLYSVISDPSIIKKAAIQGQILFNESYNSKAVMKFFDYEIFNSSDIKEYWSFYFKNHFRNNFELILIYFIGISNYLKLFNRMAYFFLKRK